MYKKLKKLFIYIVTIFVGLLLLSFIVLSSYRWYLLKDAKKLNRITAPDGIESLEKLKIGGIEQWIYIRSEDKTKPILLFLHGGPGSPEMFFAKKKFQGKLENEFVVVHWDQRGAGKSYSSDITEESMNINQFVSDTVELTKILLNRFKQRKLYLVGHSWGSVIGLYTVHRHPELFYAYIGIGQVVNMQEGERISYNHVLNTARRRKNNEAIKELEEIGEPPYKELWDLGLQRKWLNRFGGMLHGENNPMKIIGWELFTFPEYGFIDMLYRFPVGSIFSLPILWKELKNVNILKTISVIKVPLYFCTGKHDYTVPFELTEKFYNQVQAPRKKLIWFEKSAHAPNFEEPDKFYDVLVNQVLKETYNK